MTTEIPPTLPWLLHGIGKDFKKTRTSICTSCAGSYKHHKSWIDDFCPECAAKEIDEANVQRITFAEKLGLYSFAVFRRYGDADIHCSWKCIFCDITTCKRLRSLHKLTKWKATCAVCIRIPRYKVLNNIRQSNHLQFINRLALEFDLDVTKIHYPQHPEFGVVPNTQIIVCFSCKYCKNSTDRSLSELKHGITCICKAKNISSGEVAVQSFLKNQNIQFIREFALYRLGIDSNMRFDFFIHDYNIAIEYDGRQHYAPVDHFGGQEAFEKTQCRDREKESLAQKHGIKLIRIPYHCTDIAHYLKTELRSKKNLRLRASSTETDSFRSQKVLLL